MQQSRCPRGEDSPGGHLPRAGARQGASKVVIVRSLLAALTAATALLATPATAAVPKTAPVLTASGGTQRGTVARSMTSRAAGDTCTVMLALYTNAYPAPVRHDGTAVSWRIPDPRRPKVTATQSRAGTPTTGIGSREALNVTLTPVRSGKRVVAWTARSNDVGYGDLHVDLDVTWPGNACGDDGARYLYRLLSLPV